MRVITGTARGKRLEAPVGTDVVRPTGDKVKEAIFSSIQFDIENSVVLDLFAGSGQLGIEALSRGARFAYFIDCVPSSCELIKRNLSSCKFSDVAKVYRADYSAFLMGTEEKFDIAFLDPPYNADFIDDALMAVSKKMKDWGIIICEHADKVNVTDLEGFSRKDKKYGKTMVSVFRKEA